MAKESAYAFPKNEKLEKRIERTRSKNVKGLAKSSYDVLIQIAEEEALNNAVNAVQKGLEKREALLLELEKHDKPTVTFQAIAGQPKAEVESYTAEQIKNITRITETLKTLEAQLEKCTDTEANSATAADYEKLAKLAENK